MGNFPGIIVGRYSREASTTRYNERAAELPHHCSGEGIDVRKNRKRRQKDKVWAEGRCRLSEQGVLCRCCRQSFSAAEYRRVGSAIMEREGAKTSAWAHAGDTVAVSEMDSGR